MTSRVVTVRSDEPVSAAVERMTRYGFSALPVVTPSFRLVGIVSLLDVLRYREEYGAAGAEADGQVRVEEIMNPDVLSMSANANAAVVAQRLRSHGELRVMPVVQGATLVGVVTRSDLLRHRDGSRRGGGGRRLFGSRDVPADDPLFAYERGRRPGPAPGPDTPVRDVMTRDVVAVGPADLLTLAAELMLQHRHTALPVVDTDWRLVGILSEADILTDPLAGRSAHSTVGSVMTRSPIVVAVGATVGGARALVADRGLRTVPVVDGDRLVGVLSRSDLL
ncbi:CBS domain-containing protein [Pseudonocardia kunmingensis]|uniref:CBS domain-containing protein n=2 Tax=Pseudonocardia kunmingensis TaxID=630975 RepID=A0A543E428_9PSEU|nr:CBS domain-containing protein [Pseudonocardia kunmingensis]